MPTKLEWAYDPSSRTLKRLGEHDVVPLSKPRKRVRKSRAAQRPAVKPAKKASKKKR